jgi:hypothetical protein
MCVLCTCVYMYICNVYVCAYIYARCMYVIYVCKYVLRVCMYVCMYRYVCMHVCTSLCAYVCRIDVKRHTQIRISIKCDLQSSYKLMY